MSKFIFLEKLANERNLYNKRLEHKGSPPALEEAYGMSANICRQDVP